MITLHCEIESDKTCGDLITILRDMANKIERYYGQDSCIDYVISQGIEGYGKITYFEEDH